MFKTRLFAAITAITLLFSLWPAGLAVAIDPPYPDMALSWYGYRESVASLRKRGAISGYPDGTFRPKAAINRAEFLKLVFKLHGKFDEVSGDCFLDVKADAWYAVYVCEAQRTGIVSGYPSGTGSVFKPEQTVVVAEAMKMLLLTYGKEIEKAPQEKWYEPYALELDRSGVLGRHSYIPWEPLTRERAADMLAKFVRHEEDQTDFRRSPGCEKPRPQPPSSVLVNGINRSFLLTIPRGYQSDSPAPFIIAFHGRTNDNARVRSYMGLDRTASEFFIAYPAAIRRDNGTFVWSMSTGNSQDPGDIGFFDALVENLADRYCIDMDRIFVVGHSLGAWAANSVACIRGGVVRASGTVAGDSVITDCPGPSAAMFIHNPHDELSPIAGAERARDMRLRENACPGQSETTSPQSLLCRRYEGCDGGNAVIWCPHELDRDSQGDLYPHHWPRESAATIVKFFREFE